MEPSGSPPHLSEFGEKLQHELADGGLLRAALECMADSVVITAADGRVLYANPAARHSRPADIAQTDRTLASFGLFSADGATPLTADCTPAARALAGDAARDIEIVRRLPGLPEQSF